MKAFKSAWTGINISVVVTIFTLIPLIANKTVLFLFPNLFFRNLVMSPHYSNFLKKPPLSNLSSNCSESVSVTIKIIKHKTQSDKPVGLTWLWSSVTTFYMVWQMTETKQSVFAAINVWWGKGVAAMPLTPAKYFHDTQSLVRFPRFQKQVVWGT